MAITYPLTLPLNGCMASININPRNIVAVTASPFSGSQQVQRHNGQWWEADVGLPPFTKVADSDEWEAFFLKLNGAYGTFLMGDPTKATPRGAAAVTPGTPLINGAGQTGQVLNIDGAPNNVTNYLRAGDMLQIGTGLNARLYRVLNDANSNGSGQVSLDIWPALRQATTDNQPVIVSNAVGLFRLAVNTVPFSRRPKVTTLSFSAVEVVNGT